MKISNSNLDYVSCFESQEKSLTLIEILIIIGIIAIIVGVSVPVFNIFQPTLQLNGAVRNLTTNLRYTQQLAVTEQINYCLQLFLPEKKYQIIQCDKTQPMIEVYLPEKIKQITSDGFTNNKVEFNPYGSVKENGTIALENTENKIKTIEVRPSGFVKIID